MLLYKPFATYVYLRQLFLNITSELKRVKVSPLRSHHTAYEHQDQQCLILH